MLVPMKAMLAYAKENHFAIPAPSAANEHALRACIEAAEEKQSPLILLVNYFSNPDICYYGRIATDLIHRTAIPMSVILDHGAKFEHAIWAIRAGFTDIMVDRSSLPYAENVAQVKELTRIAHSVGVGVEAELGHVGSGVNYESDEVAGLTVPKDAVSFVEETGVDSLAVAIGTAHGVYKGTPKIHFDLLKELNDVVPVPLILHGGSGTGDENISKACTMGICKVNLANDLYQAAIQALSDNNVKGNSAYGMYSVMAKAYKNKVEDHIRVCGSENTANGVLAFIKNPPKRKVGDSEGLNEAEY